VRHDSHPNRRLCFVELRAQKAPPLVLLHDAPAPTVRTEDGAAGFCADWSPADPERVPVLDLFAGAGGLSFGLKAAGLEPVAAVEINPYAASTYQHAHDVEVIQRDARSVDFRQFRGKIAVVAGGPPCQPFSTGGLRLGDDDIRDGFPEFIRAVREIKPEAFLIENVAAFARGRTRPYYLRVLEQLHSLGFDVSSETLAATDYGVPQRRERVFIVGLRNGAFKFPRPTHGPGRRYPWTRAGSVLSVDEALGEPNPAIVTYAKKPHLRPSPYDGLLFNGGGRPIDLSAPARTVIASAGGNKTPFVDTLGIVPDYHASLLKGCKPRSGTVSGARRISVAESATLQTFPRSLTFDGPRTAQYALVGNAVPPKLAAAVCRALARALRLSTTT
jgi:DNA (cytosine-5)-methyltransferase 1